MSANRIAWNPRFSILLAPKKSAAQRAFVHVPQAVMANGLDSWQVAIYRWAREQAVAQVARRAPSCRRLQQFELN